MTLLAFLGAAGAWSAQAHAESHLMRFADVHDDSIVFTYEGDLWLASAAGGDARRITNDPGTERFAKFSPDGKRLAFTANYDGGTDVYVMDARGGPPTRLTYHPAPDYALDWFPDGQAVLFRSRRAYPFRGEEIYKVSVDGGLPERLPVDRAGLTALSPDGTQIAYNRISRESRTWKRYKGGMAQDIWVGSLAAGDFQRLTDWPGSDNFPMWADDSICYTSDREFGTLNLYKQNVATKEITALTSYPDFDVKYPSIGTGKIVYQYAESLHLLDLQTGEFRKVEINIPSDLVKMRPAFLSPTDHVGSFGLSPSGTRLLIEMRGEIVNAPVTQGEPINLTRASASREKNATWSPDGRWVAFISDRTGEEELYLVDQKGQEPARRLTEGGKGFLMQPVWSPDSKWLLHSDKFLKLNLVDAATGKVTIVDQGEYDDAWERWGIQDYVWSPDSRWIAYTKMEANLHESIFLYSLDSKKTHRVTDDAWNDFSPSFDGEGRYLYFLSNRSFAPTMGAIDQNHIFLDVCRPYLIVLAAEEPSPFAPQDSEQTIDDADGDKADGDNAEGDKADGDDAEGDKVDGDDAKGDGDSEKDKDEAEGDDEKTPKTVIHLENFARRTVVVEDIKPGNYFRLEATKDGFLYLSKKGRSFLKYQAVTDKTTEKLDLYYYNIDEEDADDRETKKILTGINNYHQSTDGKKLVYRSGRAHGVVDVAKEAEVGDGKVDLAGVKIKVDRPAEFAQIFNEAWRVQRDWFYDPGMHGVDWNAMGEKYRKFVPYCGDRSDLNYLIGEMIGELGAGHTYIYGGEYLDRAKRISTGLLGVDFEPAATAAYHQIAHIVPGHNWNPAERSPLSAPGCPVQPGDYLISIDGEEVARGDNPYRLLENKADRVVTLGYNSKPTADGVQTYRLRTLGSERTIRYRQWVDRNRQFVEQQGQGRIGYLHLPNMMEPGLIEFAKAFFPAYTKDAIVIDIRYNGGGFVGDMIVDRLERKLWALTQPREGKFIRDPERVFHGHLVVVMNEDTGSNGEYFAETIKIRQLAKLIGMRTWGGAVGIEPHQILLDGATTTPPQFAPFGINGEWLIEGHGVVPDIEVQNMPGDVVQGRDAQLETAISVLLEQIKEDPMPLPERPAYPKKPKPTR